MTQESNRDDFAPIDWACREIADEETKKLIVSLFWNMNDRRGYHVDCLPDEILESWAKDWEKIVENWRNS